MVRYVFLDGYPIESIHNPIYGVGIASNLPLIARLGLGAEQAVGRLLQDHPPHSTNDRLQRRLHETLSKHVAAFDANRKEVRVAPQITSPYDTPREVEALLSE